MAANRRNSFWAIVTLTALLLTACNPIPAEPVIPTPVPTPSTISEREPMQATLHDFASLFAMIDDDRLGPELYADAVMKFVACIEEDESFMAEIEEYTPGELATGQWMTIMFMMAISTQLEITLEASTDPDIYAMLKVAYTLCIEDLQ